MYSNLGTGTLNLLGQAQLTLTDEAEPWDKTVTGTGVLSLDRTQGVAQNGELIFTEDSIANFGGTIALKNWDITLDANGKTNTYTAIKNSEVHQLILGEKASAVIDGNVDLGGKTITVYGAGRLTFTGVAAPGNESSPLEINRPADDERIISVNKLPEAPEGCVISVNDITGMELFRTKSSSDELVKKLQKGVYSIQYILPDGKQENITLIISERGQ